MKLRFLLTCLSLILASLPVLRAQDAKPDMLGALVANDALEAVIKKVRAKAEAGQRTAEALAPEIKELDENAAEFSADKESAAQFVFMKGMLYAEVINDLAKARDVLAVVKRDYPGTEAAKNAGEILVNIEKAAQGDVASAEIKAIVDEIMAKVRAGARTEDALAAEIAKFDALAAKHAANPEAAATVAFTKAVLYMQILNDAAKARTLLSALAEKYPGTMAAETAPKAVAQLDEAAAKEAAKTSLVGKTAPELNFTWASKDGLKTLSGLKGQVVVLDFWATWCGPCIRSFPQIREHVAKFKGAPVAFIGVTSLQGSVSNLETTRIDTKGDPAKEMSLMPAFMKKHEITWDIAFSAEPVFNPAYGIEGIPFLAIIAPDGTVRHAGLHPGDPDADVAGKIEALLKEFNLPVPTKS